MSDQNIPQNPQPPYQQPYGQQPYPQQQPYPPQYVQQYAPPAAPTNSMAIVALVAAICGFTAVPFIGSIVAVIVGPMARKQIRQTGENGDGMALAGVIIGWVGVAVGVLVLFFAVIVPLIFVASVSTTSIGG